MQVQIEFTVKPLTIESDDTMNYLPLSEARDALNVQWYRSAMEPQRFRELSRRNNLEGWIQAGGHLALFMSRCVAVYFAYAAEAWLLFVVAIFYYVTISSFFRGTAPREL